MTDRSSRNNRVSTPEETPPDETYGDEAVCPWCGAINQDAWDHFTDTNDEGADAECDSCDKPIRIERIVSIDYRVSGRK